MTTLIQTLENNNYSVYGTTVEYNRALRNQRIKSIVCRLMGLGLIAAGVVLSIDKNNFIPEQFYNSELYFQITLISLSLLSGIGLLYTGIRINPKHPDRSIHSVNIYGALSNNSWDYITSIVGKETQQRIWQEFSDTKKALEEKIREIFIESCSEDDTHPIRQLIATCCAILDERLPANNPDNYRLIGEECSGASRALFTKVNLLQELHKRQLPEKMRTNIEQLYAYTQDTIDLTTPIGILKYTQTLVFIAERLVALDEAPTAHETIGKEIAAYEQRKLSPTLATQYVDYTYQSIPSRTQYSQALIESMTDQNRKDLCAKIRKDLLFCENVVAAGEKTGIDFGNLSVFISNYTKNEPGDINKFRITENRSWKNCFGYMDPIWIDVLNKYQISNGIQFEELHGEDDLLDASIVIRRIVIAALASNAADLPQRRSRIW